MKRHAVLTCGFTNMLDTYDKLNKQKSVRVIKATGIKPEREPLRRLARAVAIISFTLMGIALSTPADSVSINSIDPKSYIRLFYSHSEANCLIKLYGKESAFNKDAIGNEDGISKAYGIPQLKNKRIQHLSPNQQIDWGMRYITHRYKGSPCLAYAHSKRVGWY